jgi:superoxide dismutase, Fe-Mn family
MWIEEHNVNHLAGGKPILVMDVFEHAFIADYGTDKASYMKAFLENVDWQAASARLG